MAFLQLNCSISKQDCAKYNIPGEHDIAPFDSSSCVPYTPWLQGDMGVCGWVGAPCKVDSTSGDANCSMSRIESFTSDTDSSN